MSAYQRAARWQQALVCGRDLSSYQGKAWIRLLARPRVLSGTARNKCVRCAV